MVNRVKVKAIGLSLLVIFIFTACGQKRALYLPEKPATNNTIPDSEPYIEPSEKGKD